jgi:transcriptional regulator with XRE-family HTH domain
MEDNKTIDIRNQRLKALRNSLGLKQKEFARSVSVSEGLISKIEKGVIPVTDKMITKIALEYEINPDWLKGVSEDVKNTDAISDSQQLRRLLRYHRESPMMHSVDARLEQIEVLEAAVKDVETMSKESADRYLKLLSEYFEKFYMIMYYLKTQNLSEHSIQVVVSDLEDELIKKIEAFATFFSQDCLLVKIDKE